MSLYLSLCLSMYHLGLSGCLSVCLPPPPPPPPPPPLSLSARCLSALSLCGTRSRFPCGLGMLVFSYNPKFFAVRHIHHPVTLSTLMQWCHLVIIAVPQQTVLPSGDHNCIGITAPSGDIVSPSSDHYCSE